MTETHTLDCSGLVCPQPVAKTKKLLNSIKSGEIIEISGDFCEAAENIKRYVENHGGKVLEIKTEGQNYYLKVQKL